MVVSPYPPGGSTWFTPTGSPGGVPSWDAMNGLSPGAAYQLASRPSAINTYPTTAPSGDAGQAQAEAERWDQYVQTIQKALTDSAGFERVKLEKQYEDAEKGRQNAWQIARLQSDTSRYGVDVGRQNMLDQLKETQRQYDQNHALEMQKFGLSEAAITGTYQGNPTLAARGQEQQYGLSVGGLTGMFNGTPTEAARQFDLSTEEGRRQYNESLKQRQAEFGANYGLSRAEAIARYSSTPDQMFMRNDLVNALGATEAGQEPQPYGAGVGSPHMKTEADFNAISGPPGTFGRGETPGMWGPAPHGPIDQTGAPIAGGGAVPLLDENSPQYRDIQARLAARQITPEQAAGEWARLTGGQSPASGGAGDRRLYAGGSPTFNERTGQYGSGGNPMAMGAGDQGDLARQAGFTPDGLSPSGWRGYSALSRYAPTGGGQSPGGGGSNGAMMQGPDGSWSQAPGRGSQPSQGAGAGQDLRLKAVRAVTDAMPPSETPGADGHDWAALTAIENIYKAKKPGSYARLSPGQQAAFGAGLSRLGYVKDDALDAMNRANPGQRSVRAA